jgi:hypothetical protein
MATTKETRLLRDLSLLRQHGLLKMHKSCHGFLVIWSHIWFFLCVLIDLQRLCGITSYKSITKTTMLGVFSLSCYCQLYPRNAFEAQTISLPHVSNNLQAADVFTNTLRRQRHHFLTTKLMLMDKPASIWRGMSIERLKSSIQLFVLIEI